jgi:hypothetical protein
MMPLLNAILIRNYWERSNEETRKISYETPAKSLVRKAAYL